MPRQARRLDPQAVDRGAAGEEQRLHVRAAKAQIGRYLRRLDHAELLAARREDPGAAGAGAIDPALDIDLHPVGHALLLVRRHVGEDPPPHHVAGAIEVDRVDVHRLPGIGDVERPFGYSTSAMWLAEPSGLTR